MKLNYEPLSKHIQLVDYRNSGEVTSTVLGISIDKEFMPSVANVIGTDLSRYKLISKGLFACNPMHVGRDERLPIALYEKDMSDMKDLDINAIVERIQDASELSYSYYKALVDRIIAEKASEKEVEHLLDYMFDVCHDDRMLNLFKKVCRRYYSLYPEMIASEILAYKEWYED